VLEKQNPAAGDGRARNSDEISLEAIHPISKITTVQQSKTAFAAAMLRAVERKARTGAVIDSQRQQGRPPR
jgi:hypothetical protein